MKEDNERGLIVANELDRIINYEIDLNQIF
jgi:hypothetical protein